MPEPNLTPRRPLHSPRFLREHPAARAFLAPQREHAEPVQHPKPRCGMCGGKVRTRTDYRAPDEDPTTARLYGRSGPQWQWWLCRDCDTGPEVGMPRAA